MTLRNVSVFYSVYLLCCWSCFSSIIHIDITYLGWHVDADSGTLVTVNAGNGTKTTAAVPEDIKDSKYYQKTLF